MSGCRVMLQAWVPVLLSETPHCLMWVWACERCEHFLRAGDSCVFTAGEIGKRGFGEIVGCRLWLLLLCVLLNPPSEEVGRGLLNPTTEAVGREQMSKVATLWGFRRANLPRPVAF